MAELKTKHDEQMQRLNQEKQSQIKKVQDDSKCNQEAQKQVQAEMIAMRNELQMERQARQVRVLIDNNCFTIT